jgi:DNA-binding NtrC family response regulator
MNGTSTRILVVDDEAVVRQAYTRVLAGRGADAGTAGPAPQVDATADGEQALQALARSPYDLVLLDLRMPGALQGLDVLQAIKARWPATEVIVVTGHGDIDSARQSVRLGAYDHLAKPVGPQDILAATRGALQHKRWTLRPASVG